MSKLVAALRQRFAGAYTEPAVHFHAALDDNHPEVCYETACQRPRLKA
jgi:hypothetical protein